MKSDNYSRYIQQKRLLLLVLVLGLFASAFFALCLGSADLSPGDLLTTLLGRGSRREEILVFNIRLPRICTALVAGVGLASVGATMQSILRNPLASASTLGISQGAAFGASLAIIAGGSLVQGPAGPGIVSLSAFSCAMTATLFILFLSGFRKMSPESIILAGVAISSLFGGATAILQYFASDVKLAEVVFWTFGDLGRCGWRELGLMSLTVGLALIYNLLQRWNYNAMLSGEEQASGLGVNTNLLRCVGMFICSLCAAVIVAFVGIINFVGLIAPHMLRRFTGSDHGFLLPASACAGALVLLLGDCLARTVIAPVILPIGAISTFLGAPVFLLLLLRGGPQR